MAFVFPSCDVISVDPILAMSSLTGVYVRSDTIVLQQIRNEIETLFNTLAVKRVIRFVAITGQTRGIGYNHLINAFQDYGKCLSASCSTIRYLQKLMKGKDSDQLNENIKEKIEKMRQKPYQKMPTDAKFETNFNEWKALVGFLFTGISVRDTLDSLNSPTLSIMSTDDILLPADFDDMDPLSDTSSIYSDDVGVEFTDISDSDSGYSPIGTPVKWSHVMNKRPRQIEYDVSLSDLDD